MQSMVEVDTLGLGTKEGAIGWQNIVAKSKKSGGQSGSSNLPWKIGCKGELCDGLCSLLHGLVPHHSGCQPVWDLDHGHGWEEAHQALSREGKG